MLASRIDRLAPADKELLQTLAVLGREFSLTLVQRVSTRSSDELQQMLSYLQLSEFINEQPTVGDIEYSFKHALTQEAAYKSLLSERRRTLHYRAASAIEDLYAHQLDDHYSDLAHHYLRGTSVTKAVHYAQLAAEQAVSRGVYVEATSLIDTAVKLLENLPEDSEHLRAELALRDIELIVARVSRGLASPEYERVARRMCELGEKIGEDQRLLGGLLALAILYFARGEPARGFELSNRGLKIAELTEDPKLLAAAHGVAGLLANSSGDFARAASHHRSAMRYGRQANLRFGRLGLLYNVTVGMQMAQCLERMGRLGEAVKLTEDAVRQSRETRHLFSLAFALTVGASSVYHYRREPEIVRVYTQEAIALSEENGFTEWLNQGRFYHGWALAELGQLEHGVAEMEASKGLRQTPPGPWPQYMNALLGRAYAAMGRIADALTMLNDALVRIEDTGEKGAQAEILRLKGEVLLMRDASATNRGFFSCSAGSRPRPGGQMVGAAHIGKPCAPAARLQPPRGSARHAPRDLQLVHRRLRPAGS